jgi:signal transduction histidine kinase
MTTAAGTALAILAAALLLVAGLWWRERQRAARLRRQLLTERERADKASHAGDAFFDLVSHELRSPIAAIIGYDELLRDGAYGMIGDAAEEPLLRIARSARYLLHLIDGTVDLARDRLGQLTPQIETVPLRDIIHDAVHAFQTNAEERALRHSTHVDPAIPDITSDPERLPRALELMLFSAVKHPAGHCVELRVDSASDGATVTVRGIRLPIRPAADDPALRTGIRLAIVEATARLLGGDFRMVTGTADSASELVLRIRATPPFDGPATGS